MSKGKKMGWVVKAWKPEALAAFEQEARRRHELVPTPLPIPERRPAQEREAGAVAGRASMRDSPLSELFRQP